MTDTTQALSFHPLSDLFPLLEGADFEELVADVRAHGVREPIWLYQGMILDGRNRYRAAKAAGVDCPMRIYDGDDPIAFVISANLRRRHLNESQRAMCAAKLGSFRHGGDRTKQDANLHLDRARAAKLLNVSERSVASAAAVRNHGAPELQRAVEHGEISVAAAADIATQPLEEQREIVARGERKILRKAQEIRAALTEQRRAQRIARAIELSTRNAALPADRKYPLILADRRGGTTSR